MNLNSQRSVSGLNWSPICPRRSACFQLRRRSWPLFLERSREPVSREYYDKLGKQCMAEVQAFEEYLNRKVEIFAYLKVESRKP